MRNFLLTTALVLPLGAGLAFAQTATTDTTTTTTTPDTAVPADQSAAAAASDAASDAADAAADAADAAGDAASNAVDAAGDAASNAADAMGDAADGALDAANTDAGDAVDAATPDAATTTTGSDATMTTTDGDTVSTSTDSAPDATATTAGDAAAVAVPGIVRDQAANELRIDWIIGSPVTNPAGEKIGNVNDLIVDGQTGAMNAAIVGVGGFLGIGEKQIAIDWANLSVNYDAQQITTDLTREEAEAAPAYEFRERETAPAATPEAGMATTTTTETTETTTTTMPADGTAAPDADPMTGTEAEPAAPASN